MAKPIWKRVEERKFEQAVLCGCDNGTVITLDGDGKIVEKKKCTKCSGVGFGFHCAICETVCWKGDDQDLDFHHWDYEQDIGILLCRYCHDHIHVGKRASHQQNLSEKYGMGSWLEYAIRNLVRLDLAYTDPDEFDISAHPWDGYWNRLLEKYNLESVDVPNLESTDTHWGYVRDAGLQGETMAFGLEERN